MCECLPQADQPGWLGGPMSGTEREQAPVPVGLHARAALSPPADLQNIRLRAGRSPEPQLQPGHRDTGEACQAWRCRGRRVHVSRRARAAHARVRGPHPQPPATGSHELSGFLAYLHLHTPHPNAGCGGDRDDEGGTSLDRTTTERTTSGRSGCSSGVTRGALSISPATNVSPLSGPRPQEIASDCVTSASHIDFDGGNL